MLSDIRSVGQSATEVSYLSICYLFIACDTLNGILRIVTSKNSPNPKQVPLHNDTLNFLVTDLHSLLVTIFLDLTYHYKRLHLQKLKDPDDS
jgi:hypothetical protein